METVTLETIHKELEYIKNEIKDIKEHMVDVDTILTREEEKELDESIKRYKHGKTKDFYKLKSELGL